MPQTQQEIRRRYYLKHRERLLAKYREDRLKNIEAYKERDRKRYAENAEYYRTYSKKYRKEHKEQVYAYTRKYQKEHLVEWMRERNRMWSKTEAGKASSALKDYKRRSFLKGGIGKHSVEEWKELKERCGQRCVCCQEEKHLTRDHIVPLSKGGMNTIDNIQPLCRSCNSSKGNKTVNYLQALTKIS